MSRESRWTDAVCSYRARENTEDPAALVIELSLSEPDDRAPALVWIAWHEVQAGCWSRLAARDSMFAWHDEFIGGYHREQVGLLRAGHPGDKATLPRRNPDL